MNFATFATPKKVMTFPVLRWNMQYFSYNKDEQLKDDESEPVNAWTIYEARKQKLQEQNLLSEQYDAALAELIRELKI